jgi:carboxypeptidase Taq
LEKTFALKRREAEALGYEHSIYDPLLDDYEPGEKQNAVAGVLQSLREQLVPLVAELAASGKSPDISILSRNFPVAAQEKLGVLAAAAIGFDFQGGRLDVTDHPFCTEIGPADTRLTTRYDDHDFGNGFFSILHEAGHGIYEQGLPGAHYGLPTGEAVSLGIHESQSRMWENLVGRSRAFWEFLYPKAQSAFSSLKDVSLDAFFFAVNDVRPSLIRTEADEATYNLHILIRFELETALLSDELAVADLPAAWNEKYRQYLGIAPPDDADGVLQDVHWSAGLVGYFPTYALGNLYAAQFFAAARRDLGNLDAQFQRGDFASLRSWLAKRIYQHGRRFSAAELVERVTGRPLSHDDLITHLRDKFGLLYGLT